MWEEIPPQAGRPGSHVGGETRTEAGRRAENGSSVERSRPCCRAIYRLPRLGSLFS